MSKKFFARYLFAVSAAALLFVGAGSTAKAAETDVIYQGAWSETNPTITWTTTTPEATAKAAKICYTTDANITKPADATEYTATAITLNGLSGSATLTGLTTNTNYTVWITDTNKTTVIAKGTVKTYPSVTNFRPTAYYATRNDVDLAWTKGANTEGLYFAIQDDDGDWESEEEFSSTSTAYKNGVLEDLSIDRDSVTWAKITPYVTVKKDANTSVNLKGDTVQLPLFAQPFVNEKKDNYDISLKGGKLKMTWQKVSGVSGYYIYASTKRHDGYKKVKTISSNSKNPSAKFKFKNKKFSNSKTYYICVTAYKTVNGSIKESSGHYVYMFKGGDSYMTFSTYDFNKGNR
ncbi:MAG: hypothetical protein K6B41_03320 [Butyrivibrio sp.]|nr:hypothetical protein [Butyrivibrio sp.]